jgi:hypothetical protein
MYSPYVIQIGADCFEGLGAGRILFAFVGALVRVGSYVVLEMDFLLESFGTAFTLVFFYLSLILAWSCHFIPK